ncbi:hypothetical protein QVD17_26841 [Tagetes erecta]|uniref:Uncharacterized protein n=1 Tax=Tagetes erecta TaxID=13708 RepID=A0AAD8NQP3_TARER|nr:hypothetical protein QVD17_26841 [Tagetes erecta]
MNTMNTSETSTFMVNMMATYTSNHLLYPDRRPAPSDVACHHRRCMQLIHQLLDLKAGAWDIVVPTPVWLISGVLRLGLCKIWQQGILKRQEGYDDVLQPKIVAEVNRFEKVFY